MIQAWNEEKAREIGERIKAARMKRGLSLQQVAARLSVSKGTAGHWETGVRTIKVEDLYALCEALQASSDHILFGRRQWPFSTIDVDVVQSLEPEEIKQIEGAIKLVAAQLGLDLIPAAKLPQAPSPIPHLAAALKTLSGPDAEKKRRLLLADAPTESPPSDPGTRSATGAAKRRPQKS